MSKRCFKCKKVKPISGFYKHPQMPDGFLNKCKECAKKDSKERERRLRTTDPNWLASERKRCRAKQANYRKLGLAHKTSNAVKHAWRKRNKLKSRTHSVASRAVRAGKITPKSVCEGCGKKHPRLEKHHPDYSKPLEVQWLCPKCHGKTRRK
jgi:hypothetical protein